MLRAWLACLFLRCPPLKIEARLVSHFALAGIGSLAFTALVPLSTLAAPEITLQGSFTGSNGATPVAALTSVGNGIYYGTTYYGGSLNSGSIFQFDSATGSITLQDSFTGSNGSNPVAALTAAGNGIYYGTTYSGGSNNTGSIFKFDSGVRDTNPVPGPLPLLGATAAFGWSRKLRRRIQQVRSVFPIER